VLSLKPDEKITSIIPVRQFEEGYYLLMGTRAGIVKKTDLMAYSNVRTGGIIGISIDDGDHLVGVCLVKRGDEVVLSTRNGMAIRFSQADARPIGRNARGVKGIKLGKDDAVVGMVVADPDGLLLTVCENGFGKRTPFGANSPEPTGDVAEDSTAEAEAERDEPEPTGDEEGGESDPSSMRYRLQRRGGKGVKDVRVTAKNGKVIGVECVRTGDEIMFITAQGMVTRSKVDDIRIVGRNTQGVKVMSMNEGDKIVTLAKVARDNVSDAAVAKVEDA
jgi:DNA gyrase subunit A